MSNSKIDDESRRKLFERFIETRRIIREELDGRVLSEEEIDQLIESVKKQS